MAGDFYRFQIGDFEAVVLADDHEIMADEKFDGIFRSDECAPLREAFHQRTAPHHFGWNCFFLRTPQQRILVDAGSGQHPPKMNGHLVEGLQAAGVQPQEIDLLFITHFHLDHIAGLVNDAGEPVYPNARLIVPRVEWAHWMREDFLATMEDARAAMLRSGFAPYLERGQVTQVEAGDEIAPGLRVVAMPGHTPGHMGLDITSGQDRLLLIADTAHFPLQGQHLDCPPRFDYDAVQASDTRRRILAQAAETGVVTLAYHFPFPGLGTFSAHGDVYHWQAVQH